MLLPKLEVIPQGWKNCVCRKTLGKQTSCMIASVGWVYMEKKLLLHFNLFEVFILDPYKRFEFNTSNI